MLIQLDLEVALDTYEFIKRLVSPNGTTEGATKESHMMGHLMDYTF